MCAYYPNTNPRLMIASNKVKQDNSRTVLCPFVDKTCLSNTNVCVPSVVIIWQGLSLHTRCTQICQWALRVSPQAEVEVRLRYIQIQANVRGMREWKLSLFCRTTPSCNLVRSLFPKRQLKLDKISTFYKINSCFFFSKTLKVTFAWIQANLAQIRKALFSVLGWSQQVEFKPI